MISVINKPHANGNYHHVFKSDDILAVDYPGKKGSCKNRKPGNGVNCYGSEGKHNGKSNKKNFKRNGNFKFKESKVSENANNRCPNSAHSAEKIMGNAHKGKLNALRKKNFVFVFYKADKHHHGAGNYGNHVCDYDNDIIQKNTSVYNKKTVRRVKAGQRKSVNSIKYYKGIKARCQAEILIKGSPEGELSAKLTEEG